jgi:hypothetical protein
MDSRESQFLFKKLDSRETDQKLVVEMCLEKCFFFSVIPSVTSSSAQEERSTSKCVWKRRLNVFGKDVEMCLEKTLSVLLGFMMM